MFCSVWTSIKPRNFALWQHITQFPISFMFLTSALGYGVPPVVLLTVCAGLPPKAITALTLSSELQTETWHIHFYCGEWCKRMMSMMAITNLLFLSYKIESIKFKHVFYINKLKQNQSNWHFHKCKCLVIVVHAATIPCRPKQDAHTQYFILCVCIILYLLDGSNFRTNHNILCHISVDLEEMFGYQAFNTINTFNDRICDDSLRSLISFSCFEVNDINNRCSSGAMRQTQVGKGFTGGGHWYVSLSHLLWLFFTSFAFGQGQCDCWWREMTVQLLQDHTALAGSFAASPSPVSKAWRTFQETGS